MDDLDRALDAALEAGDPLEFERLAAEAETRRQALTVRLNHPLAMANGAAWYATHGFAVFPLQSGTKIPLRGSHGLHDASTDIETIMEWWTEHPAANIGYPTGHRYDVIDVDGPVGYQSMGLLREKKKLPPILGRSWTPHGMHLWVAASGATNHAGWAPGLDHRGLGGYVVIPPSIVDGRRYEWWNFPEGEETS